MAAAASTSGAVATGGIAAAAAGAAGVPARGWRELAQVYKQLSKARLSLLVVSTSAAGYVLGSPEAVNWAGMGWCCLGTFCASAAANTLNQVYEISNDSLMKRTRNRPLPMGRISRAHALGFAAAMGTAGTAMLYYKCNPLTAALGSANIALYAGVYTPLKVVSPINTLVGAVVGAIPPLMGWAAASGGLEPGAAVLAAGLYFWQIPHFLALAWLCRDDYARGGYAMLSKFDPSGRRTAAAAFRNCVYMFPLGMAAVATGLASYSFAYLSALATGALAATSTAFYSSPTSANARLLFRASLLHLPLWMAALVAFRLPQTEEGALSRMDVQQMWARLHGAAWRPGQSGSHPGMGLSAGAGTMGHGDEDRAGVCPAVMLRSLSSAPFPLLPVPTFAASAVALPAATALAAVTNATKQQDSE